MEAGWLELLYWSQEQFRASVSGFGVFLMGERGLSRVGYPCLACVPQLPLPSLTSVATPLLLCPGTLPPAGAMWLAHRLGCGCWFRPSLAPEVLPTLLLRSSLAPICLAGKHYHYGLLG